MADLSRLYDFTSGDTIRSAEVDGEFNQLVARSNVHNAAIGNATGPNNSVYKTLRGDGATTLAGQAAGTYFFNPATGLLVVSPVSFTASGGGPAFYLDDADYAVGSLTAKLRVRAQVSTNGTIPAITFTFGLYPVTSSGGPNTLTATLGTVVASSTAAIASPAANSTISAASADVNVPADGLYCLGVVTSATLTASAMCLLSAQLQTRNV